DIYTKYDEYRDVRAELGGFDANVPLSQLDLEHTAYNVIIYYDNNDADAYYHTNYRIGPGGVLYEE
ncbi:MAG: hypothetical protein J5962_03280, partial [Lachnospiraceae bacterium]|nr:hypothetical protein [Lachnospiraceae bacterium]